MSYKGFKHPEETKKKISIAKMGNKSKSGLKLSEETKRKISQAIKGRISPMKGKHHSEETIKKLKELNRKENHPCWGKHPSLETRKKLSELKKGEKHPFFGKHHTKETKKKIGDSERGEKSHFWLGGKSFEPYGIKFNKQLKEKIRKRDRYRCQECLMQEKDMVTKKGKVKKLNIHHIDYNKRNNSSDNLISLCQSCHSKTGFNREDWSKYLKKKTKEVI